MTLPIPHSIFSRKGTGIVCIETLTRTVRDKDSNLDHSIDHIFYKDTQEYLGDIHFLVNSREMVSCCPKGSILFQVKLNNVSPKSLTETIYLALSALVDHNLIKEMLREGRKS